MTGNPTARPPRHRLRCVRPAGHRGVRRLRGDLLLRPAPAHAGGGEPGGGPGAAGAQRGRPGAAAAPHRPLSGLACTARGGHHGSPCLPRPSRRCAPPARRPASTRSASRRPSPFDGTRAHLEARKAAGLHGGMQFTYRRPERSTDPRRSPARRPLPRGRSPPLPGAGRPIRAPPPTARVAAYATEDHYGALRAGLGRGRRRARRGRATPPARWWTTTAWSTARPPTAPAWAGTARARTCCCPGRGAGSCSARCSPTPTSRPPREPVADGCGAVHPLHRRLPDRRHRGPRGGRRPPLPGLAGAGARRVPGRAPGRARRPHLRLRHLPGGVPAQPPAPAGPARRPATARARRCPCSTCCGPPTRSCWPATAAGTSPSATPTTCAATRSWSWATSATAPTRTWWPCSCALPAPPEPAAAGPRGVGGPAARAATTCSTPLGHDAAPEVRAELDRTGAGHRREAPARHQRLPAEARWHPDLPLGAVAAPPARRDHRAHDPARGRGGLGPGAAVPGRAQPPAGAPADPGGAGPDRRPGRRGGRRAGHPRPRAAARRRWARASPGPTGSCSTAPRSRCPAGHRSPAGALRRTLLGARFVVAAGGYPADEAERAAGRGLPIVVVPPGVDHTRFAPLDAAERRAARARFGLPDDALVVAAVSRLVPRKGFDTVIRAAARLATHPPGPARRDHRRGTGPRAARAAGPVHGRAGPLPRSRARRRPARRLRLRRPVRHGVPQPVVRAGAGGLRHRLPRGRGQRDPADRRAQRRRRRGGGRRHHRSGRRSATTRWRSPARWPGCSTIPRPAGRWRRPGGPGSGTSCPTTASPSDLQRALDSV